MENVKPWVWTPFSQNSILERHRLAVLRRALPQHIAGEVFLNKPQGIYLAAPGVVKIWCPQDSVQCNQLRLGMECRL